MGKDGAGGGETTSTSCRCKPESKTMNPLITTLAVIDKELARLHQTLREGNGNDAVTQDQINTLHEELVYLSASLR